MLIPMLNVFLQVQQKVVSLPETIVQLVALLNKQPHRPQMSLSRESGLQLDSTSSEQQLAFMEFLSVMVGLAAAPPSEGVLHFVAGEIVAQRA